MPAFYAHSRFGARVAGRMKGELKEIIRKYYRQFEIGLQGPDLYFFYRAYGSNPVSKYGIYLHGVPARPFFEHGLNVVQKAGRESREYAYLLGFLCHFVLDSECHPYVSEMMEKTGVAHMEIEEEYEKLLLRMDGKNPFTFPIADRVPTDKTTAKVIAKFYQPMESRTVRKSLKWLKFVKNLFTEDAQWKQNLINKIMKAVGKYEKYKGVMNQLEDNQECLESNEGLLEKSNQAEHVAVQMMYQFDECLRSREPLPKRFDRTFE